MERKAIINLVLPGFTEFDRVSSGYLFAHINFLLVVFQSRFIVSFDNNML